jgi:ribonuclease P protein component
MKKFPFPTIYRLTKKREFQRVYEEGKAVRSQAFTLIHLKGEEDKPARLGITIQRNYGKAVRRNRMKRLLREAFRLQHPCLTSGEEIVIHVQRGAEDLSFKEVYDELASLLKRAELIRVCKD